jgi:formamidopyrimidine-DNA glycosylase
VPEGVEVELYRRAAATLVGERVVAVDAPDAWFLKHTDAAEVTAALVDAVITSIDRRGKLLLLRLDTGVSVGLRFGMTGRLLVSGPAGQVNPVAELRYGAVRDDATWDRFAARTARGVTVRVSDPRRLGAVELAPDEDAIGPDFLTLTARRLTTSLDGTGVPIKAALLDQARVGGLGNMLVDEICWQARLDPAVPTGRVRASPAGVDALAAQIRATGRRALRRGGSHTGELPRDVDAPCRRDGSVLQRRTIGGRTTFSCPVCQSEQPW